MSPTPPSPSSPTPRSPAHLGPAAARYHREVDPADTNSAHGLALALVGRGKRVLELGCTSGHVTEHLVANHCTVVGVELDPDAARANTFAEHVLVGDLDDLDLAAELPPSSFDAVLAGDVLEHLADPAGVLRRVRPLLRPGGTLVVSLPNVAHGDVRLMLLDGEWTYSDDGLLDRTHRWFFTRSSAVEMISAGGFVPVDVRPVPAPLGSTELARPAGTVDPALGERLRSDPDAEVYQFVIRAVPDDGETLTGANARHSLELQAHLDEVERRLEDSHRANEALRARLDEVGRLAEQRSWELEEVRSSRSYRLAGSLGRVRARLSRGPRA